MKAKMMLTATVLVLAAQAANAEATYYMRSPASGVLTDLVMLETPQAAMTCDQVLASPDTVQLDGFVSASWDFAASYLRCWQPEVEARVLMQDHGGGLRTAEYPISIQHTVESCGLHGSLGNVFRVMTTQSALTLIVEPGTATSPGLYGISISCILAGNLVMTIPLELVLS